MASHTLTIRLGSPAREILSKAAKQHGTGLSGYVRQLAEAEAQKLRAVEVREARRMHVDRLRRSPEAMAEVQLLDTPQVELPDEPEEWLRPWRELYDQAQRQRHGE